MCHSPPRHCTGFICRTKLPLHCIYRGWTELKLVRWHQLWSVHTCGTYTSQVFIVISGLVWTRLTRHWWTVYTACDDRQNFAVARHDAAATAATAHAPSNGNWNVYYTWLRHRVGRGSLFKTQLSVFAPNPNHGSYYLNLTRRRQSAVNKTN